MEYELSGSNTNSSESDNQISSEQDDNALDTPSSSFPMPSHRRITPWRAFFIRSLALLCACTLSIGSHYGSYILGPLKSRLSRELGTSNAQFSLIISAYSLNSTWTPLIGGFFVMRLGSAWTSILATSLILLGQTILLIGDAFGVIPLMVVGMFIFGLGISPLSVAQETIIVRFFKSHGLGVSLALGLVAGKGASFIAAETSYPLSERFGPRAPFVVATSLAAFSFMVNIVYLSSSVWLAKNSGVLLEPSEQEREPSNRHRLEQMTEAEAAAHVAAKKTIRAGDLTRLGDVFWLYIGINLFCGAIWSPFTHLAANIIEHRYSLNESLAGEQASLLLAGSVVLYPLCGYISDRVKRGLIVYWLFISSSALTLLCYLWLSLPPTFTLSALPAMISFGLGHGFAPLLLVLIVPQIVPLEYVPTALGTHKSIEQAGSTISQTLAGLALDKKVLGGSPSSETVQQLLNTFLLVNVVQFGSVLYLWRVDANHRKLKEASRMVAEYQPLETSDVGLDDEEARERVEEGEEDDEENADPSTSRLPKEQREPQHGNLPGLTPHSRRRIGYALAKSPQGTDVRNITLSRAEQRRGEVGACLCIGLVISTWVLFLATAWVKLRRREEQTGS